MSPAVSRSASTIDPDITAKGYVHPEVLVTTSWLAEHLDDPTIRVIESDEDVLLYETGHIPGAQNRRQSTQRQSPRFVAIHRLHTHQHVC